jgi:pilus assembly protein Flp/PilA
MLIAYARTVLSGKLHQLKLDNRAVTAIEYALIAALIAVVIIAAVTTLGKNVSSTFNKVASEL